MSMIYIALFYTALISIDESFLDDQQSRRITFKRPQKDMFSRLELSLVAAWKKFHFVDLNEV